MQLLREMAVSHVVECKCGFNVSNNFFWRHIAFKQQVISSFTEVQHLIIWKLYARWCFLEYVGIGLQKTQSKKDNVAGSMQKNIISIASLDGDEEGKSTQRQIVLN